MRALLEENVKGWEVEGHKSQNHECNAHYEHNTHSHTDSHGSSKNMHSYGACLSMYMLLGTRDLGDPLGVDNSIGRTDQLRWLAEILI